jgi:8-oxo-dGTP diphosphatase
MPAVTTDCIIIKKAVEAEILLIQRKKDPFKDKWALPGGFVEIEENLEEAAHRELEEETGISGLQLKQFKTVGTPGRDPRGRTISVVYFGYLRTDQKVSAGDDAAKAAWYEFSKLPPLAFDHEKIISEFLDSIGI